MANIVNVQWFSYQPMLGYLFLIPNAIARIRFPRVQPFNAKPTQAPE